MVLGAISLDLFAMLLGGVTALLPIYAKDVLDRPVGPRPAALGAGIGALAISIWLAHHQLEQRVGHVLFVAVAAFGAATVAFRVLDLDRALDPGARGLRRGRRGQRRDPPFAGADADAERDARPRAWR